MVWTLNHFLLVQIYHWLHFRTYEISYYQDTNNRLIRETRSAEDDIDEFNFDNLLETIITEYTQKEGSIKSISINRVEQTNEKSIYKINFLLRDAYKKNL